MTLLWIDTLLLFLIFLQGICLGPKMPNWFGIPDKQRKKIVCEEMHEKWGFGEFSTNIPDPSISSGVIMEGVYHYTYSLRLNEVRIPNYVVRGSDAQLECLYDLDGDALYSVKWYKDGNEFYRYVPRDIPPSQTFLLPGVMVDQPNSTDVVVTLKNVNLSTTGRFRCEVSGEAPSFQTVTEHGDLMVVYLPDKGPVMTGGRPRYQIGDWVRVNCTSGRSKPAVELTWFVNGEQAEPMMIRSYEKIISGHEALETTILGLQFRVEQHHFRNGDMKLKCVARLLTIYWRSNEESVEGDRPQKAPVLESRETVYASNSRADPVQASRTDNKCLPNVALVLTLVTCALSLTPYQRIHLSPITSLTLR